MQFMQMGAGGAAGTRLIFPAPAGDPRIPLLAPPGARYSMDVLGRPAEASTALALTDGSPQHEPRWSLFDMPIQGRTCALSAERQAELIRADLQDAKQARKAVKAAEDDM